MQQNNDRQVRSSGRPRIGRTHFVGVEFEQSTTGHLPPITGDLPAGVTNEMTGQQTGISRKLTLSRPLSGDWSPLSAEYGNAQSIKHLLQLSGMMRPLRKAGAPTTPLPLPAAELEEDEDGYWPLGIQQVGPLPVLNLYGNEPFGRTLPHTVPVVMGNRPVQTGEKQASLWKQAQSSPIFKASMGLLPGLLLLILVSRFVDLSQALQILGSHVATPQGLGLTLLIGVIYLASSAIRGLRWKLLLNPIGQLDLLKTLELYQVAGFLNFLWPVRAGEAARSISLKRLAAIPISKSLPTLAMDRTLDVMAALLVLVFAPLLGIAMNLQLWLITGLAGVVLLCIVVLFSLALRDRSPIIHFLQKLLGSRLEGFITGLLDSLLACTSRPMLFLPAALLTVLAILCDGLLILLAFATLGIPLSFGTALFGYTIYQLFSILPSPPGQIGSNQAFALLAFAGLLHLSGNGVIAMSLFSHIWIALVVVASGFACLQMLGLTLNNATNLQGEDRTFETKKTQPG